MLHLTTLGKLEVRSESGALDALLAQPKRVALLLHLALARPRGFRRRDALLALFWPELEEHRARNALSQALSFLRRELGAGVVVTRGAEEVGLDHALLTCDAMVFEEAVEAERWDDALRLYGGDLLPGLHAGGSEIDRWLDPERDRLRAMAAGATRALARQRLTEGDAAAAEELAGRALRLAPTDEDGARSLIQALAEAGNRTAALRFYRRLADSLEEEFDIEPSAATRELAGAVRDGAFEAGVVARSRPVPERRERAVVPGEPWAADRQVATAEVAPTRMRRGRSAAWMVGAATILLAGLVWAFLRPAPPSTVARYELAFPPGQEPLDEVRPTLALSPDGSFIAYVGPGGQLDKRPANGRPARFLNSRLWIKRRVDVQATPLEGTEGARIPSVSPDGAWVSYWAGNQLRKIPVGGGASVAVADSAALDAPAWLDDGTVAYTDASWRLRRTSADGGPAEVLWTPPDTLYAGSPVALPGSRGLLFVLCDLNCRGSIDYWVLDLHTGEARLLLKGAIWVAYASRGDLVYAHRDGTVYAVSFDPSSLRTTGSAVQVLNHVKVDVALANGPSPDIDLGADGTLLYRTGVPMGRGMEFVWMSRDGVATPVSPGVTFDPGAGNWGWALSPDGARVAFRGLTDQGDDIWVEDTDGALSRLTTYPGNDRAPHWSPDGTQVTFVSHRDGNLGVWTKRADGVGEATLLFDAGRHLSQGFWTPDGKWLVMRTSAVEDSAGDRDILAARPGVDSVARSLVASRFVEWSPAVSPDSRWIAYQTDEDGASEIVVRPFPDVDDGKWVVSAALDGGTVPVWAHNGHELFYVTRKKDLVSVQFEAGRTFRPGKRQVLFHLGPEYPWLSIAGMYDIAPDDQHFLFIRQAGAGEKAASRIVRVDHWTEELKAKVRG